MSGWDLNLSERANVHWLMGNWMMGEMGEGCKEREMWMAGWLNRWMEGGRE